MTTTTALKSKTISTGVVLRWSPVNGYGFVSHDGDARIGDVFIHFEHIESDDRRKNLLPGARVRYVLATTARGYAARSLRQLRA